MVGRTPNPTNLPLRKGGNGGISQNAATGDALEELRRLYHEVETEPDVRARFQEWKSHLSLAYGEAVGDAELFVRHTYLSTMARLVALHHVEPEAAHLSQEGWMTVVNGDFFRERDIYNFAEEDLFTWTLNPRVLDGSLELVRRMASDLTDDDPGRKGKDLLEAWYWKLAVPEGRTDSGARCTPDWLAERVLLQELKLQDDPDLSVLDPSCGCGTFLFAAIRLIMQGMSNRGEDEFDTLLRILNGVMGVDVDPSAVAIARTSYLLALGDLVKGPHPPVLIPIYLADAAQPEESPRGEAAALSGETSHIVETTDPAVIFEVPDAVADDPAQLDWLFHRLGQYLHAALVRADLEGAERATEGVLNALFPYLTSPKRAGLRELPPLSSGDADVLCRTARTLIRLALEGKDGFWLHILKNAPAPVFLSRRKFDLVVGNSPTEAAARFFARYADLYLGEGARIAMVMPRTTVAAEGLPPAFGGQAPSTAQEPACLQLHMEKIVELEDADTPLEVSSCVVVGRKGSGV